MPATSWKKEEHNTWVYWFHRHWALQVKYLNGVYMGTLDLSGEEPHTPSHIFLIQKGTLEECQSSLRAAAAAYFQQLSDALEMSGSFAS
jgi:hypothetical protein